MQDYIILNSLFILFPILCYLLYIVYENAIGKTGNDLFLCFAMISSLYLITKYSIYFDYRTDIIKILLLICILKNKKYLSILIACYMSLLSFDNYSLILILLQYFIEISLLFVFFKDIKDTNKIIIFLVVEILCEISFGYMNISYIIISNLLYVFITYILYRMISKIENLIDLYGTVREVVYEKNFRESLFKVTHEIKNPIAVCKGYLDMLDLNDSKKVNKYIPIVKDEIDRTLTIMNDFLNLTKLNIEKDIIDLSMLIDDITLSIESLLNSYNIHFICENKEDEIYIEGDYNRLKQVFINLIKNSIESIDKSKIGIIKLIILLKKDKVIMTLEDNGSGMNKEVLNKIGEPFFTTKERGTGLGIKLSAEIIELHNGTIKYKSKIDEGTKVRIELPLYN